MKLFLIMGRARTGKDTVSQVIGEYCQKNNLKHINLQFAFYIKEYAKQISGWDGQEETKPRKLLQEVGTEIARKQIDQYMFTRRMDEDIQVYQRFFDVITISDGRLAEEIEYLKEKYPSLVSIQLLRDQTKTNEASTHLTEISLDNYHQFDYVVDNNNSIEKLKEKVLEIIENHL